MSGNKKLGCLVIFAGIWLTSMVIYTPIYLIFFNSSVNVVEKSTLLDFMFAPTRLTLEREGKGRILKGLEQAIEITIKNAEAKGVDLSESLEDAFATQCKIYQNCNNKIKKSINVQYPINSRKQRFEFVDMKYFLMKRSNILSRVQYVPRPSLIPP